MTELEFELDLPVYMIGGVITTVCVITSIVYEVKLGNYLSQKRWEKTRREMEQKLYDMKQRDRFKFCVNVKN